MKDICLFYDLISLGGIESSINDILYTFKDSTYNLSLAHIHQYFTQTKTLNHLKENAKSVIDIGKGEILNTDIFISATIIFDYANVLPLIKAKKKILWIHTIPNLQCTFENIFLYKEYYSQFDEFICVSEESKKGLLSIIPNAKVKVIHNTINQKRIMELSKESVNMKKADLTFVTVSRIGKEKGFDKAIKFIDKIHNSGINYVWYIVGAGFDDDTINLINEAIKKYNIVITGHEINPYKYLVKADYGLLLSPLESWSIVYDEAHILGVPTITMNMPVYHERNNPEKMGILLDDELDFKIEDLINNKNKYKEYLKDYYYINDYDKWQEVFRS